MKNKYKKWLEEEQPQEYIEVKQEWLEPEQQEEKSRKPTDQLDSVHNSKVNAYHSFCYYCQCETPTYYERKQAEGYTANVILVILGSLILASITCGIGILLLCLLAAIPSGYNVSLCWKCRSPK